MAVVHVDGAVRGVVLRHAEITVRDGSIFIGTPKVYDAVIDDVQGAGAIVRDAELPGLRVERGAKPSDGGRSGGRPGGDYTPKPRGAQDAQRDRPSGTLSESVNPLCADVVNSATIVFTGF